jgi:thiamine pyrophosphokinase
MDNELNSREFTHIQFGNSKFDCLLCLDANLPDKNIFDLVNGLPILAADGAAIRLIEKGIEPDFIVGDLDSFYSSDLSKNIDQSKIICIPDQETNDFNKSIDFAISKGWKNIIIFGIHGGELEHTLNNWSVFMKYSGSFNLCIYDEGRYGFTLRKSSIISVKEGELISLIPQPFARLSTNNLKWKLSNEVLELGIREGARNLSTGNEIGLEIFEGELLVFIDARLPFAPVKTIRQ